MGPNRNKCEWFFFTLQVCYGAEFSEDVMGCPDFENDFLNCDTLHIGMVEGKEAELGLNGVIEVFSDIEEGTEVNKVKTY